MSAHNNQMYLFLDKVYKLCSVIVLALPDKQRGDHKSCIKLGIHLKYLSNASSALMITGRISVYFKPHTESTGAFRLLLNSCDSYLLNSRSSRYVPRLSVCSCQDTADILHNW